MVDQFPPEIDLAGTKYLRADTIQRDVKVDPAQLAQQLKAIIGHPAGAPLDLKATTATLEEIRMLLKVHGSVLRELQPLVHQRPGDVNLEPLIRGFQQLQQGQEQVLSTLRQLANLTTTINSRLSKLDELYEQQARTFKAGFTAVHQAVGIFEAGVTTTERLVTLAQGIDENVRLLVGVLDSQTAPAVAVATAPPRPPAPMPVLSSKMVGEIVAGAEDGMATLGDDEELRRHIRNGLTDLAITAAVHETIHHATTPPAEAGLEVKRRRRKNLAPALRRQVFEDYIADADITVEQIAHRFGIAVNTAGKVINEVAQADGRLKELRHKREAKAAQTLRLMSERRRGAPATAARS